MERQQAEKFAVEWASAQAKIAAFIRTLAPDRQVAEELLQRVAITLVRKFDQFDASRSFAAWGIGVARYEVLYYRREQAVNKLVFDDEIVGQLATSFQRFADEESDPYRESLEACIDQLDGRGRQVLELYYAEGLKSPAIARAMNSSPGAIRMLLCRVREISRRCIEQRISERPCT